MQELARRCDTLIRLVEKENEEYETKEGGGRKPAAAKAPGGASKGGGSGATPGASLNLGRTAASWSSYGMKGVWRLPRRLRTHQSSPI